jgi:hypothetical protein
MDPDLVDGNVEQPMLRNLFAIVSGCFAMMIVITFVELASSRIFFPLPPGLDLRNASAVAAYVTTMPVSAQLLILSGWLLGAFTGAFVAASLAIRHRLVCALTIGAIGLVLTAMNAMSIPHPAWMLASGLLLPLPLAWLATRLSVRLAQKGLPSTR